MSDKRNKRDKQQRKRPAHQPRVTGHKPSAEQRELRNKKAERRKPRKRQYTRCKERARPWHDLKQTANVTNQRRTVLAFDPPDQKEHQRLCRRVIHKM